MNRAAKAYAPGVAAGTALVLARELSFWGGVEPETGRIIDRSHPDLGKSVDGKVLVMAGGRGSSSSSSVLAETIRRGTGPVAVLLSRPDPIITVGALVAASLYGIECPVVVCSTENIASGDMLRVETAPDGTASVERLPAEDSNPA
ncbi:aconitase X swivel domain-containing protein [Mesorhizobium sp. SP-1A]|uniref:aconitase X swivel domain-containing protein n=1 Tax=Mesorhizobium sp. SP-1A TaxID=3077840 RepID=UPI0028F70E7C|nr:DUF126 domain-containing protein [Mesorhizobium sp. SP-1A]